MTRVVCGDMVMATVILCAVQLPFELRDAQIKSVMQFFLFIL